MPAHKTASQNSHVSPIHIRNKAKVKRVLKATDVEFRYRATARTDTVFISALFLSRSKKENQLLLSVRPVAEKARYSSSCPVRCVPPSETSSTAE